MCSWGDTEVFKAGVGCLVHVMFTKFFLKELLHRLFEELIYSSITYNNHNF